MDEYLSSAQIAAELGISERSVRNFIKRGHFPGSYKLDPSKRNSPYRIPRQAFEDYKTWLKQNQQ